MSGKPTVTDVTESEVWRHIYEELWQIWREGYDLMMKTESGMEAAGAKAQMKTAIRMLKFPSRLAKKGDLPRGLYLGSLKSRQETELKKAAEREVSDVSG